jgi:hypothetical protein
MNTKEQLSGPKALVGLATKSAIIMTMLAFGDRTALPSCRKAEW